MKKYFISYLILFSSSVSGQHRMVSGNWIGSLDVGVKLRIVFHFKADSTGKISATMDSPDQNAQGIPVSSVIVTADSLHAEVGVIKGRYDGGFKDDTTLSGTWSQGIAKVPLELNKTDRSISRKRPQTPREPYSYLSKDVEYYNADHSIHFGGTLTYPAVGGPFPTIILISGSGQQDRDETLFDHKPFLVIADHLTKQGFEVLRVDDRAMGKTTGDLESTTSADLANDVETGITFLKSLPQTDTNHLGLIGHSEGGLIASIIAGKRRDIDFIVLLAGPGMKGSVLLEDQAEAVLRSMRVNEAAVNQYRALYKQVLDNSLSTSDTAKAFTKVWSCFEKWKHSVPTSMRAQVGFSNDETAKSILGSMINTFSTPWMKYFLESDASRLLRKTTAKVLALNGEKDIQVLPKNLEGIKLALQKSKSKSFAVKVMPGLNHLFQKCFTCTVNEYSQIEETINPEALTVISNWLNKNVINK